MVVWGAVQQQEDERGGAVLAGGQQRPQVQEQQIQTLMLCKQRNINFISQVKRQCPNNEVCTECLSWPPWPPSSQSPRHRHPWSPGTDKKRLQTENAISDHYGSTLTLHSFYSPAAGHTTRASPPHPLRHPLLRLLRHLLRPLHLLHRRQCPGQLWF